MRELNSKQRYIKLNNEMAEEGMNETLRLLNEEEKMLSDENNEVMSELMKAYADSGFTVQ